MKKLIKNFKNLIRVWGPQMLTALAVAGLAALFAAPDAAMAAFDPDAAGETALNFFKLILIVACAVIAIVSVAKSSVVPALVSVAAGAFIYVMLTPSMLTSLGEGLATWLGIK